MHLTMPYLDGLRSAAGAGISVELASRRRLIQTHPTGHDLCTRVTLRTNRKSGSTADHRKLPDMRERVG